MLKWGRRLKNDDRAGTAIEYALIAALVSMAAVLSMQAIGVTLQSIFNFASNAIVEPTQQVTGGS